MTFTVINVETGQEVKTNTMFRAGHFTGALDSLVGNKNYTAVAFLSTNTDEAIAYGKSGACYEDTTR